MTAKRPAEVFEEREMRNCEVVGLLSTGDGWS